MTRRGHVWRGAAAAALALLLLAARAFAAHPGAAVATVNGVPVTAREFVEAQQLLRFRFERDPAGLRRAALAECIHFQVTLQVARSHGVLEDTGDAAVRAAFAAENERRAGAKAAGATVYGPVRFTWPQFRRYWLDQVERESQAVLDRRHGTEAAEELRAFHAAHPERFTAPRAAAPMPFAEVEGHVRDQYRLARYQALIREAVAAARITTDDALIDTLDPSTW